MKKEKKALLIVAHGSHSQETRTVFEQIVRDVKNKSDFNYVAGAYLELMEPQVEQAAQELCNNDIAILVIAPYFLFEGVHYKRDIGAIITKLRTRHTNIEFKLAGALGYEPRLTAIVLQRAEEALTEKR